MEATAMEGLITKMYEIKQQIKKLKADEEQIRSEILIDLKTKDLDSYETEDLTLKLSMSKRKTFNKILALSFIESKNGNPDEFYTESDVEMLKIKPKAIESDEQMEGGQ